MKRTSTIRLVHIDDFDLNLLHVFQAVHEAASVSRAAERLGMSQPAVSHALARLRTALRDPLFVRAAGGVAPTPRAERFARQAAAALELLGGAIHESERFDPARSHRRFAVHMSDIGADEFLPLLMAQVRLQAPDVRLEAVQLDPPAIAAALESGRIDLAFGYLPGLTGTERTPLLDEHYVVLLREGHPHARRLRDREALHSLDFILVASHSEPARALHLLGLESRIRLTLPHFTVAPSILEASDLAVVMPSRPARRFAARHALQVVEADLGLPPFTVSTHWVWRMNSDPGHRWLRALVQAMRFDDDFAPAVARRRRPAKAADAAR
jgi:DNA-binding transcriptional LysR family regulator